MTIDTHKNTYRTFNPYPNILLEYPGLNSAPPSHDDLDFAGKLRDISTTIARKHHDWTLAMEIETGYTPHKAVALRVYQDGEQLGRVRYFSSSGYTMSGKGISAALRRRSHMETKDFKKVIQTLNKLLAPTSWEERIRDAVHRTRKAIAEDHWTAWNRASSEYQTMAPLVMSLLAKNPEGVRELLMSVADEVPAYTLQQSMVAFDRTVGVAERAREPFILQSIRSNDAGQVFVVHGDRYLRGRIASDDVAARDVVTMSELPDDTRTKLALLKMSTPGKFIDNVGFNVDDITFLVFD